SPAAATSAADRQPSARCDGCSGRTMTAMHRFVLVVLADLAGRRDVPRRLVRVDRDGFEDFLRRRGVEVIVPDGGGRTPIRIERPDDFHPDAFVDRVPGLAGALHEHGGATAPPSAGASVPLPPAVELVAGSIGVAPAGTHAGGGLLDAVLSETEDKT